jgi:uncharacterized protein (TIGR02452 family)
MDFQRRIAVYNETQYFSAQFRAPFTHKYICDKSQHVRILHKKTRVKVYNEDSIRLGAKLKNKGYKPLVLIFADDRFAGGAVAMGSGAQEESLFRRTNLCKGLLQETFYPIKANESVIAENVSIFRDIEANNYAFIQPYTLDFIACPGIHNPKLEDNMLNAEDTQILRTKLQCIFLSAQSINCDALVLGPLGCGAWRCPPAHIATIFKEEIEKSNGAFSFIAFACLEVDQNSYIVKNRNQVSNYAEFNRLFAN